MRLGWALIGGAALGVAAWWWTTRDSRAHEEAQRERRAEAAAEALRPVLYRWRDADGVLQITEQPPSGRDAGRPFERVEREPYDGIQVRGDRSADPAALQSP